MSTPQVEKTLLVALVPKPVVDAHRRFGRALGTVGLRDHDETCAVRRPRHVFHVVVEGGALLLAALAIGDEHVPRRAFLPARHLAAIRDEGDARAVRRPPRQQVFVRAARELSRRVRRAGAGHEPDRGSVPIALAIDDAHDTRDRRTVRGQLDVGDETEAENVVRNDRSHGVSTIPAARSGRSPSSCSCFCRARTTATPA